MVAAHESSCGELDELGLVAEVQAAVADVRRDQVTVREERADDRRSHPEIVVVVLGELVDAPVRQAHGRLDPIGLVRQRRVDSVRPGEIGRVVRSADEVLDRVDGDPGGDLARRVSAHAVRDDEEPQVLGADEAIFVQVTNRAGFAQAECLHARSLAWSLPRGRDTTLVVHERSAKGRYPAQKRQFASSIRLFDEAWAPARSRTGIRPAC